MNELKHIHLGYTCNTSGLRDRPDFGGPRTRYLAEAARAASAFASGHHAGAVAELSPAQRRALTALLEAEPTPATHAVLEIWMRNLDLSGCNLPKIKK